MQKLFGLAALFRGVKQFDDLRLDLSELDQRGEIVKAGRMGPIGLMHRGRSRVDLVTLGVSNGGGSSGLELHGSFENICGPPDPRVKVGLTRPLHCVDPGTGPGPDDIGRRHVLVEADGLGDADGLSEGSQTGAIFVAVSQDDGQQQQRLDRRHVRQRDQVGVQKICPFEVGRSGSGGSAFHFVSGDTEHRIETGQRWVVLRGESLRLLFQFRTQSFHRSLQRRPIDDGVDGVEVQEEGRYVLCRLRRGRQLWQ